MAAALGETLFKSRRGADVIFVVNGEEISAHRAVLSAYCQYFDTMLFGSTNEAKMNRIELKETPAKQFKQIVRYCYLRSLEVNDWDELELLKLLSLAHEYQFDALMNSVELELLFKNHINADTIDVVFTYANRLERANLIQNCLTFAERNAEEVLREDYFSSYSAPLLSCMLERKGLRDIKQELILTKIGKWRAGHSNDELKWILKKVNWSRVSGNTLVRLIEELVDTCDFTELKFWEAIAKEPMDSSIYGSMSGEENDSVSQLCPCSSTKDVTPDPCLVVTLPKVLVFQNYLRLKNGVEHEIQTERSTFSIFYNNYFAFNCVRMKFRERAVFLREVHFEVGINFSQVIVNIKCNGTERYIQKLPRSDYCDVRFSPYNEILVPADQWIEVTFSKRFSYVDILNLTVRGRVM